MATVNNYLGPINFGTSTSGNPGTAEDQTTLGTAVIDTRIPPSQYHFSGLQVTRVVQLATKISAFMKGGTRLQVLPQSSNPFGSTESGFYVGTNGTCYAVSNGTPIAITAATSNYQEIEANGTPVTQQPIFNFTTNFAIANDNTNTRTTIDLGTSGVTAGTYGDASHIPVPTFDAFGRCTGITTVSVQISESEVTNLITDLTARALTATTVTAGSGLSGGGTLGGNFSLAIASAGVTAAMLATGAVDLSTTTATGTLAAGRVPAFTGAITNSAGSLATTISTSLFSNSTTLASAIVSSSLTSVGTIATGTWAGTTIAVNHGGTGLTTLTSGSVMIGAGTSSPTFVAPGSNGNVLVVSGGVWTSAAPAAPAGVWVLAGTSGGITAYGGTANNDRCSIEATSFATTGSLSNAFVQIGTSGHTQGIYIGSTSTPNVGGTLGTIVELDGYGINLNSTGAIVINSAGATGTQFQSSGVNSVSIIRSTSFGAVAVGAIVGGSGLGVAIKTSGLVTVAGGSSTYIGSDDYPPLTQTTTLYLSGATINIAPVSGAAIGVFGATAVVQQTASGATGFTANAGTPSTSTSTYTGGVGSTAYTVGDIVAALKKYGLLVS